MAVAAYTPATLKAPARDDAGAGTGLPSGYMTTDEAARQIQVSVGKIRHGCRRYRQRIEDEKQRGTSPDWRPSGLEIACIWFGKGTHTVYYVNAARLGEVPISSGKQEAWRSGRRSKGRLAPSPA
jgi:hypothetical protein